MIVVPLIIREKPFGALITIVNNGDYRFSESYLYYITFFFENIRNSIENLALFNNKYVYLFSILSEFVKAVEVRDTHISQHLNRVASIAVAITNKLNCLIEDIEVLNFASCLHDIGKIGIRDDILLKPGRLTEKEFNKIKEHPLIGAKIVGQLGLWSKKQLIIKHHHERYDGTGYPGGLKNNEIPYLSQILSVADAFDAMTSNRALKKNEYIKDEKTL